MHRKALRSRKCRAGGRETSGGLARQGYASHAAPEGGRRQRRLEPSGAARGQHVIRPGDVIAERGGGRRTHKQAAGIPHPVRKRLGLLADELEMLGGDRLGDPERGPHVVRLDQLGLPVRAMPLESGRDRVEQGRVWREAPDGTVLAMLGLGAEIGRASCRERVFVGV